MKEYEINDGDVIVKENGEVIYTTGVVDGWILDLVSDLNQCRYDNNNLVAEQKIIDNKESRIKDLDERIKDLERKYDAALLLLKDAL